MATNSGQKGGGKKNPPNADIIMPDPGPPKGPKPPKPPGPPPGKPKK